MFVIERDMSSQIFGLLPQIVCEAISGDLPEPRLRLAVSGISACANGDFEECLLKYVLRITGRHPLVYEEPEHRLGGSIEQRPDAGVRGAAACPDEGHDVFVVHSPGTSRSLTSELLPIGPWHVGTAKN